VDVLGPTRDQMADCPDGTLSELGQAKLVDEVIAAADSCFPDGLLVFDSAAVEGYLDHVTATSAGLMAAQTLALPVLGWALSEEVAAQLNHEFGNRFTNQQEKDVDLRVTVERARQRVASHSLQDPALPGSARWRRLELLANTKSLRWLRPAGAAVGDRAPGDRSASIASADD
jgi:LmbE family N-acetylglucosaminyl deacetylase